MSSKLFQFFNGIVNLGIDSHLSENFARRISLTNQIILLLTLASAPYIFIFHFMGNLFVSRTLLLVDILFLFCLWANYRHKYTLSRFGILFFTNLAIFFYTALLGKETSIYVLFFSVVGIPLVIFETAEKLKIVIGTLMPIFGYFLLDIARYSVAFLSSLVAVPMNPFYITILHYTVSAVSFLISILFIRFLLNSNEASENRLRQANADLQTAYTDLKQTRQIAEKMSHQAAYASLTKGIAHEIRNPLTPIRSHAQWLEEEHKSPDPETGEFARTVIRNVDRILDIVNVMLKYGAPAAEEKTPTAVVTVLQDAVFLAQSKSKQNHIAIETAFPGEPVTILGDANRLHQAFLNILLNAIQAIEQKGVITVRCEKTEFMNQQGKMIPGVRIDIKDTGKGIEKENLDKIFDPFFTTRYGSTGLGLPLVLRIVHEHNGVIKVQSEVNKGTTMTVFLPEG